MNHIYIARHGQSVWNLEGKVQGATDIPLTEKGIQQAHDLAERIATENVHIDEIIHSPLDRATVTARIIAERNSIPLRMDKRLLEQNFGSYEGHEWNKFPGVFHEIKKQFATDYHGGESMLKMAHRVYSLLDELKEETLKTGKTYLLVSHGGVMRMVHTYFFDMTNEEFSSFHAQNCELREYVFKE